MGNCYCCSDSPESDDYTQFDTSEEYSSSVTSRNINNRHRRDGGNNGSRGRSRQSSQARAPQGTSSHNTNRIMVVPDQRQRTTELFRPTSSPMTPKVKDDQMKLAQRQGIISQIPSGLYDMSSKKHTECAICMIDFEVGDEVKYLPCMHVYHKDCIDDWLMRSLRCPACMEPVDAALLSSFDSYGQSQ